VDASLHQPGDWPLDATSKTHASAREAAGVRSHNELHVVKQVGDGGRGDSVGTLDRLLRVCNQVVQYVAIRSSPSACPVDE
jgi:hypothetical protein